MCVATVWYSAYFAEKIGGIRSRGLMHTHFNNACASALPDLTTFMQRKTGKAKRVLAFYCRPIATGFLVDEVHVHHNIAFLR